MIGSEERVRAEGARPRIVAALRRAGGDELVTDAAAEARWYADLYHPWDGAGPEPPQRRHAELAVLTRRLECRRAGRLGWG